jgi:hypothetical protein
LVQKIATTKLRGEAFPQRWLQMFQRNVPQDARLPLALQESLRGATQIYYFDRVPSILFYLAAYKRQRAPATLARLRRHWRSDGK